MKNKWRYHLLMAVLLLPLFFINVKDSHDWGDDFAQYLIQARNIVEGRKQTDNGLLINEKDPVYAIEAYPVGVPLLITPVYYFAKLSIKPYCILFSIVLFVTGIILFEFFRRKTNEFTAVLLTLLFCYNSTTIDLKKHILSELPFTCILIFFLLWPEIKFYKKKYSWLITGILLALLTSTRLAGLAVAGGFILYELRNFYGMRLNFNAERIRKFVFAIGTSIIVFLILNQILFPIKSGNLLNFYSTAFSDHELQMTSNLNFYFTVSKYFFPFFGFWIPSIWILVSLAGWIIHFIKKASLSDFVLPLYILLIVLYPYSNAGLRFLIPIFPLLLFYSWYLFNWIFSLGGEKVKWFSTGILLIVLSAYAGPLLSIIDTQNLIEEGPQQKESVELFSYLKSTPPTSAVVFCKARAISLYSNRSSLYAAKNESNEEAFIQFHRYKILYLVIAKAEADDEIYDQKLSGFISMYSNAYIHVWENEKFNVYSQR